MVAAQDEQTQIRGAVEVLFSVGNTVRNPIDPKSFLSLPRVVDATPLLWNSIHICYEDKVLASAIGPIHLMQGAYDASGRMKNADTPR